MARLTVYTEGNTDYQILKNLLSRCGVNDVKFDRPPKDKAGAEKLAGSVFALVAESTSERVAFVADADPSIEDPTDERSLRSRWDSLTTPLRRLNYPVRSADPAGSIPVGGKRGPVGIWLMPDNARRGMLEDFFLGIIPATDQLLPHVDNAIRSLPEELRPVELAKARVNTWLAWQRKKSDLRSGHAVEKGLVDPHSPLALAFVAWVNRLLSTPVEAE